MTCRRGRIVGWLALAMTTGCPIAPLGAQDIQRIVPTQCAGCKLEIVSRRTLPLTGVELVGDARARRMPTGYTVVANALGHATFIVVDGTGRVVSPKSAVGAGPGEFQQINFVEPCRGDSLLVYDGMARRFSLLTQRGGYKRSFQFQGVVSSAVCTPQYIVAWGGSVEERTGRARLILLDYAGKQVGDHRPLLPDGTTGGPISASRLLVVEDARTALTVPMESYAIEAFDLARGSQRILVREVEWFPRRPMGARRLPPWVARPEPIIRSFQLDRQARLWTLIIAAHPKWKRGQQFSPQKPPSLGAKEEYFEAIVEVIDPRTSTLLGAIRLPGWVNGFLDDSTVYGVRESEDGTLTIPVWTLRLTTGRR